MKFLSLLILAVSLLVLLPVSDSFALRQMAGIPQVTVYPGGSEEFTWGLISDGTEQDTIVNIRAEGVGAEFLVYPESVLLEPGVTKYVTILVEVPESHKNDDIQKSYSPSLFATKSGEQDGAVVINVSMEKQVNIILELPSDTPENAVMQEQKMQGDSDEMVNISDQMQKNSEQLQENNGGCLIATAVYGTELAPQVQMLREIRDDKLLQTESGKSFMKSFNVFYYSFSPAIADYQRENESFNAMVQLLVTPMISTLYIMEYAESELQVVSLGIGVIALNGLFYGIMPATAVIITRKVLQK